MKKIITHLLFVTIIATSVTHSMHAYRWIMTNWTNKTILVQLELLASDAPFYVFVLPRKSADFNWPLGNTRAGFCLGKIKYIVMKDLNDMSVPYTLRLLRSAIDKAVDKHGIIQGISTKTIAQYVDKPAPYDQRITAELHFLKDNLYNQVIDQAKKIGGSTVVGWFADQIAHSKCRSRDVDIVEDENGQMQFYTLAN
jgi:hypothetical protein